MKLTSLKITKAERAAKQKACEKVSPCGPGDESYPYGLCIRLDKDALEKLGLKPSQFKAGDAVEVMARGSIKSTRTVEGSNYDTSEVEIQIESLGVEKQAKSALAAVERGIKDAS